MRKLIDWDFYWGSGRERSHTHTKTHETGIGCTRDPMRHRPPCFTHTTKVKLFRPSSAVNPVIQFYRRSSRQLGGHLQSSSANLSSIVTVLAIVVGAELPSMSPSSNFRVSHRDFHNGSRTCQITLHYARRHHRPKDPAIEDWFG